jgi:ribosomal protein L17
MLANLATALFEHCKITTTGARARRLRPVAGRLITFAKRGDRHARRQVLTMVTDRNGVHTPFAGTGPSLAAREGGHTQITRANSWCWSRGTGDTAGRVRRIAAPRALTTETASCYPTRGGERPRLLNVADMMQNGLQDVGAASQPARGAAYRKDICHPCRSPASAACCTGSILPVVLSAPSTRLRQPPEQTAWTPALAHLADCGAVVRSDRSPTGERPGS